MRNVMMSSLLIAAVAAVGCVQERGPDLGDSLPRGEDVRVKLPDSAAMEVGQPDGPVASTRRAELGQLAEYYVVTRTETRSLNFSVGWVLTVVRVVVQLPPTTIDANGSGEPVYDCGPHPDARDPAAGRLIVAEHNANHSQNVSMIPTGR